MERIQVAAYCRVSTEQDDQQNSLENQKQYFETYIQKEKEWNFAGIYADEGISGTSMDKRKAFCKMLMDAKAGRIHLILTKEVSRFARNTVDTLLVTRELKSCGVGVIFTIDQIDTRQCDGEIRLTLMASMAQEESRKTSERVKWGQRRQMEKGVVFGRRLFGYDLINGTLFVNEAEARIVKKVFSYYEQGEKDILQIVKWMNGEGIRTTNGNEWSKESVRRMLLNEKYAGHLIQKKTYTPDYLTHKKKKNSNLEEMIQINNHHEAIVMQEVWENVQNRIELQREKERNPARNRYWCSGKIVCGICGNTCVSRVRRRKDGSVRHIWQCKEAVKRGNKGCAGKGVEDFEIRSGFLESEKKLYGREEDSVMGVLKLEKIVILRSGENMTLIYSFKDGKRFCFDAGRYRRISTS